MSDLSYLLPECPRLSTYFVPYVRIYIRICPYMSKFSQYPLKGHDTPERG
jgi:hypothetical protein